MADMGVTETGAIGQATVIETLQTYLQQESRLMDKITKYPVQKGDTSLKIGRAGGFTVNTKSENTAVTAQTITYAADTLNLDTHQVIQVRLEDIADEQAKSNIIADMLMRMGKDMAYAIDQLIVTKLILPSASAPDHRIAYTGSALGKADLLYARQLLHIQNIVFSECYIGVSPAQEAALLAIDDFVHVDKYGANATGLSLGEIGRLYGAPVIMSNAFADAKTIVWHPTAVALAMQIQPKFEQWRDLVNLATLYSLSQLSGVALLDSGKRNVMLGTAS
jgi:hypothetical protein